jgi:hypothetical protein
VLLAAFAITRARSQNAESQESSSSKPEAAAVTSVVGEVLLPGGRFAVGSSLTAGSDTAVLRLSRGGEVFVCPGTTLSVTPSNSTKELMLGMSNGALETHYALDASADTVLTPDFRIQLAGPGEFHYAISTDSHGNTCVRALTGNTSAAIVSELLGDRIYQVKPTEQAMFHSGRIDKVGTDVPLECGCPPVPGMLAAPPSTSPAVVLPSNDSLDQGGALAETVPKPDSGVGKTSAGPPLSTGPETRPLPPSQPDDVHIQIDAPFVFHAKNRTATPAVPTDEAAALPVMESPARQAWLEIQIQAPSDPTPDAQAKAQPRRLMRGLRRIGRFFAAIFS